MPQSVAGDIPLNTKQPYTHVGPGLPPLYGTQAKALILGSFPSPKSREQGFFYGHPQNRFWPMLAAVTGEPVPDWADIEAKKRIILRNGLAVLVREGSASRNLTAILRGVIDEGVDVSSLAFCTDDKHLADIRREGTIRHCVQMAIELGMEGKTASFPAGAGAQR